MKPNSIASRERIMQSLHLDLAEQKLDQQESKNSIKKNWRYLIFSHINRPDSLTELSQIRKVRICTLCIDAHLFYRFLDHLLLASHIRHILWSSYSQIA